MCPRASVSGHHKRCFLALSPPVLWGAEVQSSTACPPSAGGGQPDATPSSLPSVRHPSLLYQTRSWGILVIMSYLHDTNTNPISQSQALQNLLERHFCQYVSNGVPDLLIWDNYLLQSPRSRATLKLNSKRYHTFLKLKSYYFISAKGIQRPDTHF